MSAIDYTVSINIGIAAINLPSGRAVINDDPSTMNPKCYDNVIVVESICPGVSVLPAQLPCRATCSLWR